MKKTAIALSSGIILSFSAQAATLESTEELINYGVGYNIGNQMANDVDFQLVVDAFVAGLEDAVSGKEMAVDPKQIEAAFQNYQQEVGSKRESKLKELQDQADAFMEENAGKPGVKTTPSGLQYRVISSGDGSAMPSASDTVTTHYHGTLTNGQMFDSSVERGEPVQFPVTGVIPGWTEALQMMSIGDKWELFVPPELGYGANPPGGLPANAVLIFEVELLGIDSPK